MQQHGLIDSRFAKNLMTGGYTAAFTKAVYAKRRADARVRELKELYGALLEFAPSRSMPKWVREIVVSVARNHGVSPGAIMCRRRFVPLAKARAEAYYRVKVEAEIRVANKNAASWPVIGRWFDRDHTTVMYGAARYAYENNMPKISTVDIERKRDTARLWKEKRGEVTQ